MWTKIGFVGCIETSLPTRCRRCVRLCPLCYSFQTLLSPLQLIQRDLRCSLPVDIRLGVMSSTPPVPTKRSFFSRTPSRSATPQPDQAAQLSKQLEETSLGGGGEGADDEEAPLDPGLDDAAAAELQGADVDSESGQSS